MIWVGIIGDIIVGPWIVSDGTEITADVYIDFRKEHLESWLKQNKESLSGEPPYLCNIILLRIQSIKLQSSCRNLASVNLRR